MQEADRRKFLAFGGLGVLGVAGGKLGPELQLSTPGMTIHIHRHYSGKWMVAVPDWEAMANWKADQTAMVKSIPIEEFTKMLDEVFAQKDTA